jgi:ribosomal protein S11
MENYKLNNFFFNIKLKKQYISKLKNKILKLNNIKNKENKVITIKSLKSKEIYLIKYVIDITFSKTNTLLHVTDCFGNLKFYVSAGKLQYFGKNKKSRNVLQDFYKILVSKLDYLNNQPIALHLKNVNSSKVWIIKKLKKKLFIKSVKIFNSYPYNGCRKKKLRRKKFRTKKM